MDLHEQIAACLAGTLDPARVNGSTSRLIALFLAVSRLDLLPEPYVTASAAWLRLDARQRAVVASANPEYRHRCRDCGGALERVSEYAEGDTLLTNWHCVDCGEGWDSSRRVYF